MHTCIIGLTTATQLCGGLKKGVGGMEGKGGEGRRRQGCVIQEKIFIGGRGGASSTSQNFHVLRVKRLLLRFFTSSALFSLRPNILFFF